MVRTWRLAADALWALPCHGQGPPTEPLQSENVLPDSINASPHPQLCTHLVRGPDQMPDLKALLSFPSGPQGGTQQPHFAGEDTEAQRSLGTGPGLYRESGQKLGSNPGPAPKPACLPPPQGRVSEEPVEAPG